MTNLVAAELLKLRTTRAVWGYLIVAVALAGLFTAGNIGSERADGRFEREFQERVFLDGTSPAVILGLLLGMIMFTNEFRHGTITRTLLGAPRRAVLVAAKLLSGVLVAVGLFVLTLVVTAIVAAIWLGALDVPLEWGAIWRAVGRGLLGAVIATVAGVAIGGFVHAQVGALVGALLWIFVLEPLGGVVLGLIDLDGIVDYLPSASILGVADSQGEGLAFGAAAAVALAWIAAATAAAIARTGRKDIT